MVQAFVCTEIPFRVVENPYMIELFYQLHPAFTLPSREMLAGKLVDNELLQVILKQFNIFQQSNNLTLGKYIYYFIFSLLFNC